MKIRCILETFIRGIESRPLVIETFDKRLWAVAVDTVTVLPDGKLVLRFKDGAKVER
jgi:hypothetical protein